ncbi:MAG TPA: hypothetical protein VHY31_25115 [Streptosporangiaceae bacterium]|nr:hypothetical protein [Streptosporangiaceae bacterium]
MANPSDLPVPPGPSRSPAQHAAVAAGPSATAVLVTLATVIAVIAGTALLGAGAGLLWASVAPRALIVVVGRGSAGVVNPETSAFIAADGWFTLLTVIGGVISGLLGYALAVRRQGALAMAGVLLGGLAAALLAKWIGQQSGAAAFNHMLLTGRPGVTLREPLAVGGVGLLAFWPLAAGLTAGGIELAITLRERRRQRLLPLPPPPPYAAASPYTPASSYAPAPPSAPASPPAPATSPGPSSPPGAATSGSQTPGLAPPSGSAPAPGPSSPPGAAPAADPEAG